MSFLFGGAKRENTQTVRDYQRKVAWNARGMEREVAKLDQREGVLRKELAWCAKEGKMDAATGKAKEIVRLRAHRERLRSVGSHMTGLAQQLQSVHTTGKVQEMISDTVGMLHTLNGKLDAVGVARMLADFERQSTQMQAKQELMQDALDSGFEADGEAEDCNEAVINVLEEVGLDMRSQLGGVAARAQPAVPVNEEELAARLERLRPPSDA
jgi:charged multivesicular body protein 2A